MMYVCLPLFPPSTNHAYFTRGRFRKLTKEGERFKNEVQGFLGKNHPDFLAFFRPNVEYEVLLLLHFREEELYNERWLKSTKVARHKSNDASNRVKLLEDIIAKTAGCNDAQNFAISSAKTVTLPNQDPFTEVWAWNEDEDGPIARFLHARAL
jgi:hypothetical protein